MILSSVNATLGIEGTVVLVSFLFLILIILFLILKKRIYSFFSLSNVLTGASHQSRTFEIRFLENKFYLSFFFVFLSVSLVMSIINLYLQVPFISLLAVLFIFCSLMIFVVYLSILLLVIWKTWWSHWIGKKERKIGPIFSFFFIISSMIHLNNHYLDSEDI